MREKKAEILQKQGEKDAREGLEGNCGSRECYVEPKNCVLVLKMYRVKDKVAKLSLSQLLPRAVKHRFLVKSYQRTMGHLNIYRRFMCD
jgi:hypothetical protein